MQGSKLSIAEEVEMWEMYECSRNAGVWEHERGRVILSVNDIGKHKNNLSMDKVEFVLVSIAKEGIVKEMEQGEVQQTGTTTSLLAGPLSVSWCYISITLRLLKSAFICNEKM